MISGWLAAGPAAPPVAVAAVDGAAVDARPVAPPAPAPPAYLRRSLGAPLAIAFLRAVRHAPQYAWFSAVTGTSPCSGVFAEPRHFLGRRPLLAAAAAAAAAVAVAAGGALLLLCRRRAVSRPSLPKREVEVVVMRPRCRVLRLRMPQWGWGGLT